MGSEQHFCLRWNNFHSNIAASFETLRDHEDFVDVTLACEGRSLKAHKVVLSACSPYFKNLLQQNPCQHPIIILRDVAFPDLSALLSFVYQGEVYVSQERLPAFLRTAEMLHIKGLTEQHQNHVLQRGPPPFSLGSLSTSTTVNSNHDHLQGMLNSNRVNSVGSAPSPSLSPSTHQNSLSHHPSPPPKKRRSVSGALGVSGSSPPGGISTSSIMAAPTSSTPPHRDGFPVSEMENHIGLPHRLRDSPSLSTTLTQPISTALVSHSDLVVTPLGVNSRPPPLKALPNATSSSTHSSPDAAEGVDIKMEASDVKQENSSPDEAVNLVTEGSILRQRIQGLRTSPDSPYFLNSRAPSSHEDSSMDERFTGKDTRSDYDRDSRLDYEHDSRYDYDRDGRGVEYDRETFSDQDKDMYHHSSSPMVIRSPLAGLLPRDAPGLFGSAGTSASLTHQGDSSQDAEYLVRACVPKLWNSRQPGICPICNRVFSNKFNLKQHIINIHTKSEGIECDLCHKKCKNKWYLRRHQVTHHGAPLKRNRSFPVDHFVNDENDRCQREKQQTTTGQ